MIDIYSGVIFECAIPERDVNSIIKQVETEISTYLGALKRVIIILVFIQVNLKNLGNKKILIKQPI